MGPQLTEPLYKLSPGCSAVGVTLTNDGHSGYYGYMVALTISGI